MEFMMNDLDHLHVGSTMGYHVFRSVLGCPTWNIGLACQWMVGPSELDRAEHHKNNSRCNHR